MSSPAWIPLAPQTTNVGRFMAAHQVADLPELRQRSVDDPAWFWDAVVRFLELPWFTAYERILDDSRGFPFARWFCGGRLNVAAACVEKHARNSPDRVAIRWEGENGDRREVSYAGLRASVDALARALSDSGVRPHDRVGIFLPMIPEVVVSLMAVAKIGAIGLPIFSGYAPEAVAVRLADADAKALLTADGYYRRGKTIDMRKAAALARANVPSVKVTFVAHRLGGVSLDASQGERPWPTPERDEHAPALSLDSEHPLFIAYTSGTTGRPKGSVHVHGGFLVKVAEEAAFQFDIRPSDTVFWFSDMGWIMGPWQVVGTLALGATLAIYEGAPDFPTPDRMWSFVERHRVSVLGMSPTLVRSLMRHGTAPVRKHDRSSLRVLGSTGEPWNEAPWHWYFDVVGEKRCPIINISGGTEVGACFLSPHPVEPIKPMSLGGPSLGMNVDVFDENGSPVRGGAIGELVCKAPWPGMTRGLYRDERRYLETYFGRWPDTWVHGDFASLDEDGYWFLHGRSDDTIKLAGKRVGPAEVESALVSHRAVSEAAAIGVPDADKGEVLWVFVVLAPEETPSDELRSELGLHLVQHLGSAFRPAAIRFVSAVPKTRSAKVLRRAIRAVVLGEAPGDLSSLEDAASLEAIRTAR